METNNFRYSIVDNIVTAKDLDYSNVDEYGMGHAFFYSMKTHGNNTAQIEVDTGKRQTYQQLLIRCVRTALEMRRRGINRGDIVSLCTNNHLDSCVPFIATLLLGGTVASLDPTISLDDTIHLMSQIKPKMIFLSTNAQTIIETAVHACEINIETVIFGESDKHSTFAEFVEDNDVELEKSFRPEKVDLYDTAVIFFSSGTTGLPKGIQVTHYSLLMQGWHLEEFGFTCTMSLGYASLYWVSTVIFATSSFLRGTCRIICSKFVPSLIWSLIEAYKITFLFMAPSQIIHILKGGRPENVNTTSLYDLIVGGGPLSTDNLELVRDIFPGSNVHLGYGQTEVGGAVTIFKPCNRKDLLLMQYKGNSSGRPLPGYSYKIVDPETEEILGPNKTGELRIKTKCVMKGYYNVDSTDSWDSDGWLKTGDVVYYDNDLCFYIVDRIKEMLKFQSWHVAPAKLEGILLSHPGVKDAIVIGIPDDDDGDHPMGIVIRSSDSEVTAEELVKYVEERVDDKQRLRAGVKFIEELPYTPSGKVKRKLLKQWISEGKI